MYWWCSARRLNLACGLPTKHTTGGAVITVVSELYGYLNGPQESAPRDECQTETAERSQVRAVAEAHADAVR